MFPSVGTEIVVRAFLSCMKLTASVSASPAPKSVIFLFPALIPDVVTDGFPVPSTKPVFVRLTLVRMYKPSALRCVPRGDVVLETEMPSVDNTVFFSGEGLESLRVTIEVPMRLSPVVSRDAEEPTLNSEAVTVPEKS